MINFKRNLRNKKGHLWFMMEISMVQIWAERSTMIKDSARKRCTMKDGVDDQQND